MWHRKDIIKGRKQTSLYILVEFFVERYLVFMKRPFIKLLDTKRGLYFYDVNCNQIVEISKESYQVLQDIMQKDDYDFGDLNDECKQYFLAGLLQSNQIKEIKNNCENILEQLNTNLQSLLLQVTRQCNLRCKYCFYSGMYNGIRCHEETHMDWETCKKSVDYFLCRASLENQLNIGFYGGEPLLNFNLIKDCVEYIQANYDRKNIQYSITTNAVLLSPSIFEFLKNHNFLITISIDGPQDIHDSNRVFPNGAGSYSVVRKNIEYIYYCHSQFMKTNVRYNAVLTQNAEQVEDYFLNDAVLSIINGKLSPLNMYHSNQLEYRNASKSHAASGLRNLINLMKNPETDPRIRHILEKLEKCYNAPMKTAIASGVCVPGVARLFVTVGGDFYMCEKFDDESKAYKIGDVETGWNEKNICKLSNISNESLEFGCKGCWAVRLCNMCAAKFCAMDKLQLNAKCEEIRKEIERNLIYVCLIKR